MSNILQWPIQGKVTSPFGPRVAPVPGASTFHNGVDIAAKNGDPVKAPLDGTIKRMYSTAQGGYQLIIVHAGGWLTGYADLKSYGNIKEGQKVKQGDIIAYAGQSGPSTGAHLHFTLTNPKGTAVDPMLWFGKSLTA